MVPLGQGRIRFDCFCFVEVTIALVVVVVVVVVVVSVVECGKFMAKSCINGIAKAPRLMFVICTS